AHITARHQQLVDAVVVEIRFHHDGGSEIDVQVRDELRAGKDRDAFGTEVVGVRSVALVHENHVSSLVFSGSGEAPGRHVGDVGNDLTSTARTGQIFFTGIEIGPAP